MTADATSVTVPGLDILDRHYGDEYAAHFRAWAESPGDDAPALRFADWLGDRGDDEKADRIRWWMLVGRPALDAVEPAREECGWGEILNASKALFAKRGRAAVVLASVAVRRWQERLYPVDWSKVGKLHADADGLRRQVGGCWLACEWAGLELVPIEFIDAAGRSAYAAGSSAYSVGISADAAGRPAYAAWSSANAAGRSADAAGSSADATQKKLYRISVAVYRSPVWEGMI